VTTDTILDGFINTILDGFTDTILDGLVSSIYLVSRVIVEILNGLLFNKIICDRVGSIGLIASISMLVYMRLPVFDPMFI